MESATTSQVSDTSISAALTGKRVLFGITKSNGGGAQAYVLMMAQGARDAGAHVSVMAGSASGKGGDPGILYSQLEGVGIPTIPLQSMQRDIGLGAEWRGYKELVKIIRTEHPDILHLNSSKMGVLGSIAGRIAGVKCIVFTAHGWPHKEHRSPLWKLMAWLGSWVTIIFSHTVIVVSDSELRDTPTLFFRDKLVLIHNGISAFPLLSREEARAACIQKNPGLADYSLWLLMNAELNANKGIDTALRAVAELVSHHNDIALVVCGEGDMRESLEQLATSLQVSSRIFLVGFVKDARTYLAAGDIVLMPSQKEGLPMALLEAGIAARAVIASKVGGIPEVLTDQVSGLFMPRGNTHILAKAISYLLKHPQKITEYGENLQKKVLADFSAEKMISKTIKVYSK